jgi:TRAP-type uncharacterized transport system fused permease subunit
VPLLFAYTPFIGGSWTEVFQIFFFALFGLYAFTAALQGFMEAKLNPLIRLLTLGCAIALLWPLPWWIHLAGMLVLIGIFVLSFRTSRKEALAAYEITA